MNAQLGGHSTYDGRVPKVPNGTTVLEASGSWAFLGKVQIIPKSGFVPLPLSNFLECVSFVQSLKRRFVALVTPSSPGISRVVTVVVVKTFKLTCAYLR